jgi:hypothetical protein
MSIVDPLFFMHLIVCCSMMFGMCEKMETSKVLELEVSMLRIRAQVISVGSYMWSHENQGLKKRG